VNFKLKTIILNAAKYVEIPQGRERIYIVGFKGKENYSFDSVVTIFPLF